MEVNREEERGGEGESAGRRLDMDGSWLVRKLTLLCLTNASISRYLGANATVFS
jgi:hypothetical protein